MNDLAKNGVTGGSGNVVFCGAEDGFVGQTCLDYADNDAFCDPVFYIKFPDREAAGTRGWWEA